MSVYVSGANCLLGGVALGYHPFFFHMTHGETRGKEHILGVWEYCGWQDTRALSKTGSMHLILEHIVRRKTAKSWMEWTLNLNLALVWKCLYTIYKAVSPLVWLPAAVLYRNNKLEDTVEMSSLILLVILSRLIAAVFYGIDVVLRLNPRSSKYLQSSYVAGLWLDDIFFGSSRRRDGPFCPGLPLPHVSPGDTGQ